MTSLTVKKNQAKIAEGIYKQTHCTYLNKTGDRT